MHGVSDWASTAQLKTETANGQLKDYFLKILDTEDAYDRVYGEYMSMAEIHKTLASIAPKPYGYGKCHNQVKKGEDTTSNAHFFLCDFLQLAPGMPNPVRLAETLAKLHMISESPTGKFGFHCTTFDGKLPLTTTWESSWTAFFTRLIKDVYRLDTEVNGVWPEFDSIMEITVEKLIPRLLDPLTANGRTIKPSLIHGDLWESNIGTDRYTGEIYIYDACAYYAHHEKEIAIWRCEHHEMDKGGYIEEYLKKFPGSEPKGEFKDRGLLYSVETLLMNSAHYPGSDTRKKAFNELQWLINKYQKDW
ncbi:Fructosamine/Ketosamine-3-kinase [Chaetomium sp. MPI-SDFR-AT-0129]|nr:Fructosamine/Ketosamine-3-kinase [Chaetomium sp. MPI-SDFR-AT-0129]